MNQYFYSNGNDKVGPVSLESLRKQKLNEQSLVWREGLENWVIAKELPELADCLQKAPPLLPYEVLQKQKSDKLKNVKIAILKILSSEKLWIRYTLSSILFSFIILFSDLLPEDVDFPVYKTNWEREHLLLYGFKQVFYSFLLFAPITLLVGIIQGYMKVKSSDHTN